MRKILILFLVTAFIAVTAVMISINLKENASWKVEITNEFINVRKNHDQYEAKLSEVKEGDIFKVRSIYLEDTRYVWYEIEYKKDTYGWIASGRKNPYVKEINNPNKSQGSYFVDYVAPVVKFMEDTIYYEDIDHITYDHLIITDDSEYEVISNIYFEQFPLDRVESQFWIKYTVRDVQDNETNIVQRVVFTNPPDGYEVWDFKDIKN